MAHSCACLPTTLLSKGVLSAAFRRRGCAHYQDAATLLSQLPYGRTSRPHDYTLVLEEGRGTCSSKHALAALLAEEIGVAVDLTLACFEMDEVNTKGVGPVLERFGLASILEAHCFLRFDGHLVDLTWPSSASMTAMEYAYEQTISPALLAEAKIEYHRSRLETWRDDLKLPHSTELLWDIREECIAALQNVNPGGGS